MVARAALLLVLALVPAAIGFAEIPDDVAETYDLGFKMVTADERFSLRLWGAIQFRYTYLDYDQRVEGNESDYSNFYMRRARLWFAGHAFDQRFTYYVHVQLEPTSAVNLHDMWLEYVLSDLVIVGAGRNKIAYGLETVNSGFALQFVERSVFSGETDIDIGRGPVYPGGGTGRFSFSAEADTGFATGGMGLYRSQGAALRGQRGGAGRPTIEYQAGIWQGRATRGQSNTDTRHLFAVRVGYHPWGFIDSRFQADMDGSERWLLGIIGSAYANSKSGAAGFDESGWDIGLMNRFRGLSIDAEWATERYDFAAFGDDFERQGWRLQAGYFLKPGSIEVVARHAEIERLKEPTYRAAVDSGLDVAWVLVDDMYVPALEGEIAESTVGVNWYMNEGHRHKLQLDASRLVRRFADDPDAVIDGVPSPIAAPAAQHDWRVRAMVQLVF